MALLVYTTDSGDVGCCVTTAKLDDSTYQLFDGDADVAPAELAEISTVTHFKEVKSVNGIPMEAFDSSAIEPGCGATVDPKTMRVVITPADIMKGIKSL